MSPSPRTVPPSIVLPTFPNSFPQSPAPASRYTPLLPAPLLPPAPAAPYATAVHQKDRSSFRPAQSPRQSPDTGSPLPFQSRSSLAQTSSGSRSAATA